MRRPNPYLLFFLLLLVPFSAYLFRPGIMGSDGYGFLVLSCMKSNIVGAEGLPFLLFSAFPCNILLVKAVLFCLAFVSGCFLIKMATLFSKDNGWRACYLVFLSSVFVLEFAKFENDQFAFPFLFASLYFFFHSLKKNSRRSLLVSLALLVPAGLLWHGAVFFPIAYTLNLWVLLLVSVPILLLWGARLIGEVIRSTLVAEDLPLQMHVHFLLNAGLWGAVLDSMLMPQALFFFALGAVSAKFWILSLPFLVVGGVLLLERANKTWLNHIVLVVAVISAFGLAQSVWLNPPTESHWQGVTYILSETDGNVGNDWGLGYILLWSGGKTSSYGSVHRQIEPQKGQLFLTEQDYPDCEVVKRFNRVKVIKC